MRHDCRRALHSQAVHSLQSKRMINTPRTDAETRRDEMDHVDTELGPYAPSDTVPAGFARQLERELAEAKQEIERLDTRGVHSCHDNCQRPMCVLRRENADLKITLAMLGDNHERELAEAREQVAQYKKQELVSIDGLCAQIDRAKSAEQQRDRLAEALKRIIEEDGRPMSMRVCSTKSIAKEALAAVDVTKTQATDKTWIDVEGVDGDCERCGQGVTYDGRCTFCGPVTRPTPDESDVLATLERVERELAEAREAFSAQAEAWHEVTEQRDRLVANVAPWIKWSAGEWSHRPKRDWPDALVKALATLQP
jgi:hypothetical protein